jgi:GWxTD domain-containing protein
MMGTLLAIGLIISAAQCPEYQRPPADAPSVFFEPIFAACPGFVAEEGAIAWQFARALDREGRVEEAIAVLERGLASMDGADPMSTDLLVYLVFRDRYYERYDAAVASYLEILDGLADDKTPSSLRLRVVDELLPILPADVRVALGVAADDRTLADFRLPPDAGEQLRAFWRGSDRFPATTRNERLAEHLARVAAACGRYVADDGRLDDRGRILIRFGEPPRRRAISEEFGAQLAASRTRSTVGYVLTGPTHEPPESEIWVYPNVHSSLHFLFVYDAKEGRFREGGASELLPQTWVGSRRRSTELLRSMEYLYRQLSLQHPDYGFVYDEVADYLMSGRTSGGVVPPQVFSHTALSSSRTLDGRIARTREATAPPLYSNLREELETFKVDVRIARFLADDGRTRVEMYWGASTDALLPDRRTQRMMRDWGVDATEPGLEYLLTTSAVQRAEDHAELDRRVQRFRIGPVDGQIGVLSPQSLILPASVEPTRLALQWDLLVIDHGGELGPVIKYATKHYDDVAPLEAGEGRFEVSDIRPVLVRSPIGDPADEAPHIVYPYSAIAPDIPVAAELEIYNLSADSEGRYRYTIDYSIERKGGRGLLGLGRGERRDTDGAVSAQFESLTSTDTALLMIDLARFDARGTIEVVILVTDDESGESIERRIEFNTSSPSSDGTDGFAAS